MVARMLPTIITRAPVPDPIESVITTGNETPAREVGASRRGVEAAWQAATQLYKSGIHPAIQVCVRRRGQVVLNRAIGYAQGNGPEDPAEAPKIPLTTDTPFNIFSASKVVTSMVVHLLDQRHLLHLEDPVCEYIPEFAAHDKQGITIRHILTHRAGIPNLPAEAMDLDILGHPSEIVEMLCKTKLSWRPGRSIGYHALSGGFVLGEIVRRVTGMTIRAVLDREIRQPLRFRWLNYGIQKDDFDKVAENYFTGAPVLPPMSTVLHRLLGVNYYRAVKESNDPRFLLATVPAGNLFANANEMSRFFELLLNGGELDGINIFDSRTIRRATAEQSYMEFDRTLGLPLRYGMGFMLGGRWMSLYGADTQHAFGHLGLSNILCWADPERRLSAAIMTSGKPVAYPELYHAYNIVRHITSACPKEKDRAIRRAVVVPVRATGH